MNFRISPLDVKAFSHLFEQDDDMLLGQGVRRMIADSDKGYPCRVSLQDARIGDSVLLMNYEHQPMPTPFRSSHAIYVRESARPAEPEKNIVPDVLRDRLLSLRAFDSSGTIVDADVITGERVEPVMMRMFASNLVDYIHIHNAKLGCYLALAERA